MKNISNIEEIDTKLLIAFDAIYSARSVSRAADILDINQPTLSNRLRRLRLLFNDQLFYRRGHGVAPTLRAVELIGSIQNILSTLQGELKDTAFFSPETDKKVYNIIVADALEPVLVPTLLTGLPPNISIVLKPPQSVEIELGLETGQLDAAIFLLPARSPNLFSERLVPLDLVAIVRQGHPRIENKLTLENIRTERFIALGIDDSAMMNGEKFDIWQNLEAQIICQSYSTSSCIRLAVETDYLTLAPRCAAVYFSKIHKLHILELPVQINDQHFFLSWNGNLQEDEANLWLRNRLRQIVRNNLMGIVSDLAI